MKSLEPPTGLIMEIRNATGVFPQSAFWSTLSAFGEFWRIQLTTLLGEMAPHSPNLWIRFIKVSVN